MGNTVDRLQSWFDGLTRSQQEEVIDFLYGGKVILSEGEYFGPFPDIVVKGLHCGPAPRAQAVSHSAPRICPTCGRPL
jgi:hypothetical protein